jgi:hypothetical protein
MKTLICGVAVTSVATKRDAKASVHATPSLFRQRFDTIDLRAGDERHEQRTHETQR